MRGRASDLHHNPRYKFSGGLGGRRWRTRTQKLTATRRQFDQPRSNEPQLMELDFLTHWGHAYKRG